MTTTQNQSNEYRCLTPQEIGKAVAMFRNLAGMKQLTLALEAGVTERTVQRIENGEKVNEESLRKIAKALRMGENSFIGPRHVLSPEEAFEQTKKWLEGVKLIDADRFATLKDVEAVLGTQGMVVDDHFVTDDAAAEVASFKDLLQEWNDVYSELFSNGEKLDACRSLLDGAQRVEARGYIIRYGVHTTQDNYRLVNVLIARRADDALCEVKQMFVPNRFTKIAMESL
jgi:transcriptional regulator with XRE-family HTH domain